MPVKFDFSVDLTPQDTDAAKQAISKMQKSGRYNDIFSDPDVTVKFTRNVEDGAAGDYSPKTNELRVAPQRAKGNVNELINTIHHEIQHSMQKQAKDYGTVGNYSRRRADSKMLEAASKAGLTYGDKELEAFVASNLRPGIPSTDARVTALQKQFPKEIDDFYSRIAQPMREPTKHLKHEAEMTTSEKVLDFILGVKPKASKY